MSKDGGSEIEGKKSETGQDLTTIKLGDDGAAIAVDDAEVKIEDAGPKSDDALVWEKFFHDAMGWKKSVMERLPKYARWESTQMEQS